MVNTTFVWYPKDLFLIHMKVVTLCIIKLTSVYLPDSMVITKCTHSSTGLWMTDPPLVLSHQSNSLKTGWFRVAYRLYPWVFTQKSLTFLSTIEITCFRHIYMYIYLHIFEVRFTLWQEANNFPFFHTSYQLQCMSLIIQ